MSKVVNVNVFYKTEKKLFTCRQNELIQKCEHHFNFDRRNVVMYAVLQDKLLAISELQTTDFMKIEFKDRDTLPENYRVLPKDESQTDEAFIAKVIDKIQHNSPLTGFERFKLTQWLQGTPPVLPKKRKYDESHFENKETQVPAPDDPIPDISFQYVHPEIYNREVVDATEKMKEMAKHKHRNKEEIKILMDITFDERRNYILSKAPKVEEVKEKYPLLFSYAEVKNELERILFPGVCQTFVENMKKYSEHIFDFSDNSDDIYLYANRKMVKAPSEIQRKYAEVVGSVFLLARLLEEEFDLIHVLKRPFFTDALYPFIDMRFYTLKELFRDEQIYYIKAEGKKLCDAPDFPEAILCLIASYFIFNIRYPETLKHTLAVLERLYLSIQETEDVDQIVIQMEKLLKCQVRHDRN